MLPGVGIGEVWLSERTVEICRAASEAELEIGVGCTIRRRALSTALGQLEDQPLQGKWKC